MIFLDKNLRNFANGLKRARKKAGYRSQKRFVEALNEAYKAEGFSVTVDTVENWEQGKSSPAMNVFLKLCDFFDCSADYLLYKIDEKNHDLQFICEYTGLSEESVIVLHDMPKWSVESDSWNNDIDYFISVCGDEFAVLLNEMRFNRSRAALEVSDGSNFGGKTKNINLKNKLNLSTYQFLDYCNEIPDKLYDIQAVLAPLNKK